jgi:hypothetical protein
MVSTSRFFRTALLAVAGSLCGNSQAPVPVPAPAPPQSERTNAVRKPDPPAPVASGEFTPGVTMVQELLASLGKYDQEGRPAKQKVSFEIPERALNEYVAYTLRTRPRPGITALSVALQSGNQVSATVEIDFDAVQKWNPDILPEMLRPLLHGKRTIQTDAKFDAKDGFCTLSLTKDAMGPEGKAIVNKVMSAVLQSLGSQQPEAYDTSKPIPLPFGLKRVWTSKQLLCGET